MFNDDEPGDDDEGKSKKDALVPPKVRAAQKVEELRMHSELAAIFEGPRKFDAQVVAGLDADVARDVQRTIAKLEKAKIEQTPILADASVPEATRLLSMPEAGGLTTGDYHLYRRPGELMLVRWLQGEQVETFYERYQAHFEAALEGCRADERSSLEWKGDEKTQAYLEALATIELKTAELYLRGPIRERGIFVLSITVADEMNVRFLASHLMGIEVADLVGAGGVPDADADEGNDGDLGWFFKLFALRGAAEGVERMCFFTFMQKTSDDF